MIILENDSYLLAYSNNDFYHIYDMQEDITNFTFTGSLLNKTNVKIPFTITKSGTNIILSLTKNQINTLGIDVVKFDVKKTSNGIDNPSIKGFLTIKEFITE